MLHGFTVDTHISCYYYATLIAKIFDYITGGCSNVVFNAV